MWQLNAYEERYAMSASAQTPCILMPGWSCNGDIFEWLLPALAQHFVIDVADITGINKGVSFNDFCDDFAEQVLQRHSQPVVLFAWSLAGNVALELAKKHPDKVLAVCLMGSTPCFVAAADWHNGMPEKTFAQFEQGVATNSAKTLSRFDVLQAKGDAEQKRLLESLKDYRSQQQQKGQAWNDDSLSQGLRFLAEMDQRELLQELQRLPAQQQTPLLWCFGENDCLVNAAVADEVSELYPASHIVIAKGAGHLPFLTQTDSIFNAFIPLVNQAVRRHEKNKVAQSFSNAAKQYDGASALQQYVAKQLMAKLPEKQAVLLDAGCGTGFWAKQLHNKCQQLIGLDMAEGMLSYAQQSSYNNLELAYCLGGDMEHLPLADDSVDTIFSSLSVQWCNDLTPLLNEWQRVLKTGGQVCLATLGVDTLTELRQSFQQVDSYQHVNQFLTAQAINKQIEHSKLQCLALEREQKIMPYDNMISLMRDLKAIGAHHVLGKNAKGLMGKKRFAAAEKAYEQFRGKVADDKLPATYDVVYITLQKPTSE